MHQVQLSYTAVQAASPPAGLISKYTYNYAAQNAVFSWTAQSSQLIASTQVGVVQKTGHTAYPLWDASLARRTGQIRPYLRLTNLSNTGYQEVPQVSMQGRALLGGVSYFWSRPRR